MAPVVLTLRPSKTAYVQFLHWAPLLFFFLSYLIQNFPLNEASLRINLRLKSVWMARNAATVISVLGPSIRNINLLNLNYTLATYKQLISPYLFSKLSKIIFPKTKSLKYAPIGLNFAKSVHHYGLRTATTALTSTNANPNSAILGRALVNYFTSQYYYGSYVHLAMLSNKPMKLLIYKFLFSSLSCWFSWSKRLTVPLQCFAVLKNWRLVKFINLYYFKIYSI